MRIGLDITPLLGNRTGVGTFCWNWARCLVGFQPELELYGFASGLKRLSEDDTRFFHCVRRLPLPTRSLYRLWDFVHAPAVDRFLPPIDVYHATNYYLPPTLKARRILTVYDLVFLRYPQYCSPKVVGPFCRNVLKFSREADAVITCSESSRRELIEMGQVPAERVFVAYGGVDQGVTYPMKENAHQTLYRKYGLRGPFLLYVGTLEPRKNIRGIVGAFSRIAGEFPVNLVLVGGMGWKIDDFKSQLENSEYHDRIVLPGYVPALDLPFFYRAAEAFLFPSFYEGFGLPVAEALACGTPPRHYFRPFVFAGGCR